MAQAQVNAELIVASSWLQIFDLGDVGADHGALGGVDLSRFLRVIFLTEVKAGEKLETNGTRVATGAAQPRLKLDFACFRYVEHLPRRKFVLLHERGRYFAILFKPFENVICLTLADAPNVTEFGLELLVQVIAMTGFFEQEAKQGVFRGQYTHSMSISLLSFVDNSNFG